MEEEVVEGKHVIEYRLKSLLKHIFGHGSQRIESKYTTSKVKPLI